MKHRFLLITTAILLCLMAISCSQTQSCPHQNGKAPDFTLQTLDGKTVKLSDYAGKNNVVVNFWATWCDYCKAEMPMLQAVANKYTGSGIVFVTIDAGDDAKQVTDFVTSTNMNLTVLLDQGQTVTTQYCISGLPLTLFINKAGIIVDYQLGAFQAQSEIESKLASLQ